MTKTVEITGINHAGEGVGRIDNTVVFVPHTAPGDIVEIEVVSKQKKYLRGQTVQVK